MKIFGINFTTKNELQNQLAQLREVFPFDVGQVVYDVQLKNNKGRYARTNPSRDHSTINEVTVDEKNYFGLVERFKRQDVFVDYDEAVDYLDSVCK